METTETKSQKFVYDWNAARVGKAVLKAIMRDFDRPEVRADFERWKKEQAAKKAREDSK